MVSQLVFYHQVYVCLLAPTINNFLSVYTVYFWWKNRRASVKDFSLFLMSWGEGGEGIGSTIGLLVGWFWSSMQMGDDGLMNS